MNSALQTLVVGLLLGWSAWVMLGRFFPGTMASLRTRLAALAAAHGHARLAERLGRAPAAGGCDSGCSSCRTGCSSGAGTTGSTGPAPVQWRH